MDESLRLLGRDGHVTLAGVFTTDEAAGIAAAIEAALASAGTADPAIRGGEGVVYAARNVLDLWPEARRVWRRPALTDALRTALGDGFGLVRGLYFDKPPGNSWALPWHKDLTIAVRDNRRPSSHFSKPTTKAGVPHVEGPRGVLERMLTARIHLDAVDDENGPLKVVSGSHLTGKEMDLDGATVTTLHAAAGDVLLIRPLTAHCSNRSAEGTVRHRRILHLEFAAAGELANGYEWHGFDAGIPS